MPPESSIGILPDQAFGHVHEALVDRRDGPPVLVLGLLKPDFQVGDDVVVAGLTDLVANLLGLGTVDEVLPQPLDDLLEVVLEVLLGAVVVDQVLDDKTRKLIDTRVDGEPLVDDLATEYVFEACIHGSPSCYRSPAGTMPMMLSSLLSRRRRMREVSSWISTLP